MALLHNPKLLAFSYEVRAREARMLQAGLYPNTGFTTEIENFVGSGDYSGFDAAEIFMLLRNSLGIVLQIPYFIDQFGSINMGYLINRIFRTIILSKGLNQP